MFGHGSGDLQEKVSKGVFVCEGEIDKGQREHRIQSSFQLIYYKYKI